LTKLRREKEEAKKEEISGNKDVETDDGDLKIPALPPVEGTLDVFSNDTNNALVEEDDGKDGPQSDGGCSECNYPVCLFRSGGPPLDTCQGTCAKKNAFHHACNVNWLESYGKDAELHKLCYMCVQLI